MTTFTEHRSKSPWCASLRVNCKPAIQKKQLCADLINMKHIIDHYSVYIRERERIQNSQCLATIDKNHLSFCLAKQKFSSFHLVITHCTGLKRSGISCAGHLSLIKKNIMKIFSPYLSPTMKYAHGSSAFHAHFQSIHRSHALLG